MDNLQTKHQLHAIRMKWLFWLSKPIVAVWRFIVESLTYVWSVIKMAWQGTKESMHYQYWILGTIGSTITAFLYLLFLWIGNLVGIELMFIGVIIGYLPMAWSYAEIAALVKYRNQSGTLATWNEMKGMLGNGKKAVKFLLVYVLIIITMVVAELLLGLLGMIPVVGSTLLGILLLPLTIASSIIILSAIIIMLGYNLIGAHLLAVAEIEEPSRIKRWFKSSIIFLKVIGKKFPDLIAVALPVGIFAYLIAILPGLLTGASTGLSITVVAGLSDLVGSNTLEHTMNGLTGGVLWTDGSGPGFFGYIGAFFAIVSLSILIGFVLSFLVSVCGSVYYYVYNTHYALPIIKKLCGVIFAILLVPFIIGLIGFIIEFITYGF